MRPLKERLEMVERVLGKIAQNKQCPPEYQRSIAHFREGILSVLNSDRIFGDRERVMVVTANRLVKLIRLTMRYNRMRSAGLIDRNPFFETTLSRVSNISPHSDLSGTAISLLAKVAGFS